MIGARSMEKKKNKAVSLQEFIALSNEKEKEKTIPQQYKEWCIKNSKTLFSKENLNQFWEERK